MSRRHKRRPEDRLTFGEACDLLDAVLSGPARRGIVDALGDDPDAAFAGLKHAMRTHAFAHGAGGTSLRRVVDALDARTRRQGLHVLYGWDFVAQRRPDDIAPVLLVDYCLRSGVPAARTRQMLAVLLDQYFLAILALLAVRAWDDGDPNANLDRVTALVGALQGPDGSGCRTVDDAETLLILAVSYYHPEEDAYARLLEQLRGLDDRHRLRVALPCAAIFGSHLRWGLRFMYGKDVGTMRDDNVVDYPWVLFAASALMEAYVAATGSGAGSPARDPLAGALLDVLSADPWAFDGPVPPCLAPHGAEHAAFRAQLADVRSSLLGDIGAHRPTDSAFSPLGVGCNFLSNAVVALVASTIEDEAPHASLNSLFAREPEGAGEAAAGVRFLDRKNEHLAVRLMRYAAGHPARLAKGGAPLIVYDPRDAAHYYNAVDRTLRGANARP